MARRREADTPLAYKTLYCDLKPNSWITGSVSYAQKARAEGMSLGGGETLVLPGTDSSRRPGCQQG